MTGVLNITFHLVQAVLPEVEAEVRFKLCVCVRGWRGEKPSCKVYNSVNDTSHFKRRDTDEKYNILKGQFDCNSNHVIYSF